MATEVFSHLESKIQALIDEGELLRLEVSELREAKAALQAENTQWEAGATRLLDKLSNIDSA